MELARLVMGHNVFTRERERGVRRGRLRERETDRQRKTDIQTDGMGDR